jgi:hypothetical protein
VPCGTSVRELKVGDLLHGAERVRQSRRGRRYLDFYERSEIKSLVTCVQFPVVAQT